MIVDREYQKRLAMELEIDRLRAINAELLAKMELAIKWFDALDDDVSADALRAALTKARGK